MLQRFFVFASFFILPPFAASEATDVKTVLVQLIANSENAGYEAYRAMDGDAKTMWHTQFNAGPRANLCPHPVRCGYNYACGYDHPALPTAAFMPLPPGTSQLEWIGTAHNDSIANTAQAELFGIARKSGNNTAPPHALGVDLGGVYPLTGFTYTAREDRGNGTFGKYELYVAKDAENGKAMFGEPAAVGEFSGKEQTYTIDFGKTVEARYIKFVQISSHNGQPFGSVAECQPIAAGYRFVADGTSQPGARLVPRIPDAPDKPELQERIDEWNLLAARFQTPLYWNAIKDEVASPASLILPEDRDPLDVMVRRFSTAYEGAAEFAKDIPVEDTAERFQTFCALGGIRKNFMLKSDRRSPLKVPGSPREILFVKRHRAGYQHMCDQFYGTNQRPGGGLFVLNIETGEVRNLLENSVVESGRLEGQKLDKGSFLSPDVSFCGTKIAFAYVELDEPIQTYNLSDMTKTTHVHTLDVTRGHWEIGRVYHIFTCNADGSNLRQITDGTWNDFDPCWLPNGRLAFISERRNG